MFNYFINLHLFIIIFLILFRIIFLLFIFVILFLLTIFVSISFLAGAGAGDVPAIRSDLMMQVQVVRC